jgi:hypothetical protein
LPAVLNAVRLASRACQAGAVTVILAWVFLAVGLLRAYFFIFDDFFIVGDASLYPAIELASTKRLGFYRPAVFVMLRAETLWFHWGQPWGYLLISHALHVTNAVLLWCLARRLGLARPAALAAAALFALSPWSTEATAWMSARFDVLCTTGVLTGALMAVRLTDTNLRQYRWRDVAIGVAGSALAAFSKETGVVAPVIVIAATLASAAPSRWNVGSSMHAAASGAVAAIYLAIRAVELPGLDSTYGPLHTLIGPANLPVNALSYLRSFVMLPLPWFTPGAPMPVALLAGGLAVLAALLGLAGASRPRVLALTVVAFASAIAPTVWLPMQTATSAAGRFLYLPGAWICLLVCAALSACLQPAGNRRTQAVAPLAAAAIFLAMAVISVVSVWHQSRAWTTAYELSHAGIRAFEGVVDRGVKKVFIPDLPFWFAEGPYVLKHYAFGRYYAGRDVPAVRVREMVVTRLGGQPAFAGWVDPREPAGLAPDERVWPLSPALTGIPPRLTMSAAAITLTRAPGRTDASNAEFTIDAPPSAAWLVAATEADGLVFEPSRGSGTSVVVVSERAGAPLADRVVQVPLFVDGAQTPVVHLAVHVRQVADEDLGPPFGALDVPAQDFVLTDVPVMLQGWALDDLDVRRVEVRYRSDARGEGVFGEATRRGERKDVTAVYPAAGDLLRSAWAFALTPAAAASVPRPFTLIVIVEDLVGRRTELGRRVVR